MIPRQGRIAQRRGLIIADLTSVAPLWTFAAVALLTPHWPNDRWWGLAALSLGTFFMVAVWRRRVRRTGTHEIWSQREGALVGTDIKPAMWPIGGTIGCPIGMLVYPGQERIFLARMAVCFGLALLIVIAARWERLKHGLVFHV